MTYIHTSSNIYDSAKIGKDCSIGAGSVVTKNIEENVMVMGLNALPLKELVGFKNRMRSTN